MKTFLKLIELIVNGVGAVAVWEAFSAYKGIPHDTSIESSLIIAAIALAIGTAVGAAREEM